MKRKPSKQINDRYLRRVILTAQQGGVSTQDIVKHFLDLDLYDRLYSGLGSGKKKVKSVKLTADEVNAVSYAITAMANTFLDAGRHIPKQLRRKGE